MKTPTLSEKNEPFHTAIRADAYAYEVDQHVRGQRPPVLMLDYVHPDYRPELRRKIGFVMNGPDTRPRCTACGNLSAHKICSPECEEIARNNDIGEREWSDSYRRQAPSFSTYEQEEVL